MINRKEKAIVDKAKGRKVWPNVEMMIRLSLGTGMRVAELAAVQVQDFDLGHEPSVFVANVKGGCCRTILISKGLRSKVKKYVASIGLGDSDYLLNVN